LPDGSETPVLLPQKVSAQMLLFNIEFVVRNQYSSQRGEKWFKNITQISCSGSHQMPSAELRSNGTGSLGYELEMFLAEFHWRAALASAAQVLNFESTFRTRSHQELLEIRKHHADMSFAIVQRLMLDESCNHSLSPKKTSLLATGNALQRKLRVYWLKSLIDEETSHTHNLAPFGTKDTQLSERNSLIENAWQTVQECLHITKQLLKEIQQKEKHDGFLPNNEPPVESQLTQEQNESAFSESFVVLQYYTGEWTDDHRTGSTINSVSISSIQLRLNSLQSKMQVRSMFAFLNLFRPSQTHIFCLPASNSTRCFCSGLQTQSTAQRP
jgi:hypothetical protein